MIRMFENIIGPEDTSQELTQLQKNHTQKACRKFLYDGRSINTIFYQTSLS